MGSARHDCIAARLSATLFMSGLPSLAISACVLSVFIGRYNWLLPTPASLWGGGGSNRGGVWVCLGRMIVFSSTPGPASQNK